jgi:hypothetical protein
MSKTSIGKPRKKSSEDPLAEVRHATCCSRR